MKKTSLLSSILFLITTFKTVNKYFAVRKENEVELNKQEHEDRYNWNAIENKYYNGINMGS